MTRFSSGQSLAHGRLRRQIICLLLAAAAVPQLGWAEELPAWGGFDVRLDTTLRAALGLRTEPASEMLLSNINADDGDRAFKPGLMSERLDVVSEFTAQRDGLGFDISAQGWYDAAYNTNSANNAPATFNPISSSHRGFPADVRTLMGKDAELLNAYAKDTVQIGNVPVTISLGRQTLLWGESLLFTENGIAAAQAPVDEIKSLGSPLATARELFLPVNQIVVRTGLNGGFSLEAYDQLEWRPNRLPGVGSYFSTSDILDVGGQRFLGTDGLPTLYRTSDDRPQGIGQFGIALRQNNGDLDWGLYALRADARTPSVIFAPALSDYHLAYARGIEIYALSTSLYAGDANIAGELSFHHNTPLDALVTQTSPLASPRFDLGNSMNGQISVQAQIAPGRLFNGASLAAEIAGNDLVGGVLPAGRSRFAAAARAIFTPQYFQVRPGLDVGVPMGVGIGLLGRSATDPTQNNGAGFVSIGVTGAFHVVWQAAVNFTHFIGASAAQPLADRDFATLTLTRTF